MLRPLKVVFGVVLLVLFVGPVSQMLSEAEAFAQIVDTAWVRRYNGPGNGGDEANAIAVDDSGSVYVTGKSWGSGTGNDYATIKYLPNGDTAWVRRYNGPANSGDLAHAIAVDDSGNAYVTGISAQAALPEWEEDYITIKYHPDGDTAWIRGYDGPGDGGYDEAYAIAVDDSGCVYVTGEGMGCLLQYDCPTIKYNPDGAIARQSIYDGLANDYDGAYAIAVDGSGNVYVTGCTYDFGGKCDCFTIRYSLDGDSWVRTYNGPAKGGDYGNAIAVDDSGHVYVAGTSTGSGTSRDYLIIKYLPNGDTDWLRTYNGPGNGFDEANAIAVDDSGNIYVTGQSWGSGTLYDYATIKYYPNGDTAWVRRYNGPGYGNDIARDIAVYGCDDVYVTGRSEGSGTGQDYATVKYLANGDSGWVMRYNGPGNHWDLAQAIALDDSGNVYVTGRSEGSGSDHDYCTIKYVQGISHVSIIDYAFVPQTDTIAVGDSVRWTNNGAEPHTSTSDTKVLWDSDTLNPGESFTFQFDSPGSYPYHCAIYPSMAGTIVVLSTDVKEEIGDGEKPSQFGLSQNYPNPFNPTTKIEFTLAKSGFVTLQIYDVLGRKVRTLVSEDLSSGYKSVLWDGKNDDGKDVASGVYFYQLKVGAFSEPKKMLLLK